MDKTLAVQLQIRQNAEEVSTALKEIQRWEKAAKNKDKSIIKKTAVPVRNRDAVRVAGGTVPIKSTHIQLNSINGSKDLTPASIVDHMAAQAPNTALVPKALGVYHERDLEELERERGNADFKAGNFHSAVKAYTKCLGLKAKNYVAFSNRAMAYIKLKEYARAVVDCNCALSIEPAHVKSLLRRSTALAALGKLRAAMRDLNHAIEIEPQNKQARADSVQLKEQLRNAVQRAPMVSVYNINAYTSEAVQVLQGPDPLPQGAGGRSTNQNTSEPDSIVSKDSKEELVKDEIMNEEEKYHRINVIEEEDGEDEHNRTAEEISTAHSVPISIIESEEGQRSTKNVAISKKKKSVQAEKITSAYELEKVLRLVQADPEQLHKTLISLSSSALRKIFKNASEPDVLALLINALGVLFAQEMMNALEILTYLYNIGTTSSFSLLYTFLPGDSVVKGKKLLEMCFSQVGERVDREMKDKLILIYKL